MRISDWSSDVCSSDLAGRLIISRTTRCGRQGRTATRGAAHLLPLQKGCRVLLDRRGACRRFEDLGIAEGRARTIGVRGDAVLLVRRLRRGGLSLHPLGVIEVGALWKRRPAISRHRLRPGRSEEHTSELQSLMRISYAVFCLKKNNKHNTP